MDKNKCLNGWAFRWAEKQAQKGNMSVQMRAFCIMLVEIYSIYTKIRLSLKIARLERKVYKRYRQAASACLFWLRLVYNKIIMSITCHCTCFLSSHRDALRPACACLLHKSQ